MSTVYPGATAGQPVLNLSVDELDEIRRRAQAIAAARLQAASDDGERDGIEAAACRRRELVDALFADRHPAFRDVAVLVSLTAGEFSALTQGKDGKFDQLGLWMQVIAAQAAFGLQVTCVVPDGGDHHLDPRPEDELTAMAK